MSFKAAAWAIQQKTKTPTQKLILIILADCQNEHDGKCFPSIPLIAERALCSERQVTRVLSQLEKLNKLKIIRRNGSSNYYILNITPDMGVTPDKKPPLTNEAQTPDMGVTPPLTNEAQTPDMGVTLTNNNHEVNQESNQVIYEQEKITGANKSLAVSNDIKPKKNKKSKLTDDFELTDTLINNALRYWGEKGHFEDVRDCFEAFKDHHIGKGTVMADWDRVWGTWYRNAVKFNKGNNNGQCKTFTEANRLTENWVEQRRAERDEIDDALDGFSYN